MSKAYLKSFREEDQGLFRVFLFLTVNTLLHELGHVFFTYLTKGQKPTPPDIKAPNTLMVKDPSEIDNPSSDMIIDEGEAGRALEHEIFEGTINYFHEPGRGTPDDQVCSVSTSGQRLLPWHIC